MHTIKLYSPELLEGCNKSVINFLEISALLHDLVSDNDMTKHINQQEVSALYRIMYFIDELDSKFKDKSIVHINIDDDTICERVSDLFRVYNSLIKIRIDTSRYTTCIRQIKFYLKANFLYVTDSCNALKDFGDLFCYKVQKLNHPFTAGILNNISKIVLRKTIEDHEINNELRLYVSEVCGSIIMDEKIGDEEKENAYNLFYLSELLFL